MPSDDEIDTKGIPHKKLAPVLQKLKERVFSNPIVKEDIFDKYGIGEEELYLMPMCFAKIPVSARTDHGIIYINIDLIKDGDIIEDDHYIVHEMTHYGQQTTGDKPTPGSSDANYLDNPVEQEGFRNQTKYISDTKGEEAAEDYIEQLLDHHMEPDEDDSKKRKDRKDRLLCLNMLKLELLKEASSIEEKAQDPNLTEAEALRLFELDDNLITMILLNNEGLSNSFKEMIFDRL